MGDQKKLRVISGIQPTGALHLGSYLGAIRQWVLHQDDRENFFFVVDLHTLTIPEALSPKERHQKTEEFLALYLACGIDPEKSVIFIQSEIKELTELTWILTCTTPLGWLERMTQFKSKGERTTSIGTGLLNYPVLMASDILIYDSDLVPVGEDQKQHLELTCEIARRFNSLFGETFKIPKVMIPPVGARIMGLDDPETKMSKSLGVEKPGHSIGLLDSEAAIKKAIMSAVTDSGSETRFDLAQAGVKNLLTIYMALTGQKKDETDALFSGKGYGFLKKAVLEQVLETVRPIQKRFHEIADDKNKLRALANEGAEKARAIAQKKMQKVRERVGIF